MSDEERKKTTATSTTKSTQAKTVTDDDVTPSPFEYETSVTWSVFVYWILPVLIIACMTRFAADPDAAAGLGIGRQSTDGSTIPTPTPPVTNNAKPPSSYPTTADTGIHTLSPTPQKPKKKVTPVPALIADKPSSYIDIVQAINNRRLDWENADADDSGSQSTTTTSTDNTNSNGATVENKNRNSNNNKESIKMERPPRGPSSDPVRTQLREKIDDLRSDHEVCNVIMMTKQNWMKGSYFRFFLNRNFSSL